MRSFRAPDGVRPVLFALLALLPGTASAQLPAEGEWRFGARIGGTGSFSLTAEYFWDEDRSVEAALGTFSLRNLTLALTAHQYLGSDDVRPVAGLGLWVAGGLTEEGIPVALLAQAPIGLDWRIDREHYLGGTITVTRGLGVRRPDPADDRPLSGGFVPFPALTYRLLAR